MTDIPAAPVQMYRVYIKATAERIFEALTSAEWTERFGYGGLDTYHLVPGGRYSSTPNEEMKRMSAEMGFPCPDEIVTGEVIEVNAPHLLKTTWHFHMDPEVDVEGPATVTYEITETSGGYCALTLTHEMPMHPKMAAMVSGLNSSDPAADGGGGWHWVLSDLKSLLETGTAMTRA